MYDLFYRYKILERIVTIIKKIERNIFKDVKFIELAQNKLQPQEFVATMTKLSVQQQK